jgi:Protein of unknown function (DUF995)
MRAFWFISWAWVAPSFVCAQAAAPTEFPAEATPMAAEALRELLVGKTFVLKPVAGDEVRLQYQSDFAYINIGRVSDTGKWRIDGTSVCYEWKKIPVGCSEHRQSGNLVYVKRYSSGEVVVLQSK